MSPRGQRRASVPKSKSSDYAKVAESFYHGAELAKEFEYWNAAGLLVVHAAIAYTDAVTIHVGGVKSQGEDHMAAVGLLKEVVKLDDTGRRAANHLARLIEQKNIVSYSGEIFSRKEVDLLWKHLERYRPWAAVILRS